MFQVFYLDVVKVDLDVAMTKYTYCKPMFQVFHVFQTYVANVSSGYCKSRLSVAGPTCRSCLPQLLGCLRGSLFGWLMPADPSAVRHPQAGVGEWDPRVGACENGRRRLLFACGATSHAKDWRRPIFWSGSECPGANNTLTILDNEQTTSNHTTSLASLL